MATKQKQSPLQSDLGTTTIGEPVVVSIVGMAVGEVDGLGPEIDGTRLPGDRSRTVGEFVDGITGSRGRTRGISVEVGERQAAVDLTVTVAYGKPVADVTKAVRNSVIQRVENLTGLEVTEVNISVSDVFFPEQPQLAGSSA